MIIIIALLIAILSFYFGRKFAYQEIDSDEFAREYTESIEDLGYRVLCPMHCDKCIKHAREYLKDADEKN